MKIKNFQVSENYRVKFKTGKSRDFFETVKSKLGFSEYKELIQLLDVPKSSFSEWFNGKLTTPAKIVIKCLEFSDTIPENVENLIDSILDEKWSYYKANRELQRKHADKLAAWGKAGGRKTVDNELGPFSAEYPKRNKNGWMSKGEEIIAEFLRKHNLTPINVELQRKKFAIKSGVSYICFDIYIPELSKNLPTYLEFMGYRNAKYFEKKLQRFIEAREREAFRLIIVTPYLNFVENFKQYPEVVNIIKFGDWKKLDTTLGVLSNLKGCNSPS